MSKARAEVKGNAWAPLLSAVVGVMLAWGIGAGVRLDRGYPPGAPPKPFARLLGKPALAFELPGLDGTTVSMASVNSAEVWLLYFTDSGCGACDAAYPSLKAAASQVPVIVVGMGDRQQLAAKLAQHQIVVPLGYDSLRTVGQLYSVPGFPSALLIDQQGVVRQAAVGGKSIEQVMAARERAGKGDAG